MLNIITKWVGRIQGVRFRLWHADLGNHVPHCRVVKQASSILLQLLRTRLTVVLKIELL